MVQFSVDQFSEGAAAVYISGTGRVKPYVEEAVCNAALPGQEVALRGLLRSFPDRQWAMEFERFNKLVTSPLTGVTGIVPRVDVDMLGVESGSGSPVVEVSGGSVPGGGLNRDVQLEVRAKRAAAKKKRRFQRSEIPRYTLGHFIGDGGAIAKFGFTSAEVKSFARMAVVDPSGTASLLQGRLRRAGHECVVTPGEYANGKKAAKRRIISAFEASRVGNVPLDLAIFGDVACFECYEGAHDVGDKPMWTVTGPVYLAREVVAVARLAMSRGAVLVNLLLEKDLAMLGLTLLETTEPVPPVVEAHFSAAGVGEGIAGTVGVGFSSVVQAAAGRVVPMVLDNRVVASMVRVTEGQSVGCWHTMEAGAGSAVVDLGCGNMRFQLCDEVGHDLWAVEHDMVPLRVEPWVRRAAVVGESAVLVYAVVGGVEFSDVVRVTKSERNVVVTVRPPQARGGLSGGALVSLTDGALLGVYHGAALEQAIFSCYVGEPLSNPEERFMYAATGNGGVDEENPGDLLYESFGRRGLGNVLPSAAAAMRALWVGDRHVGMAVAHGAGLYSTLDPSAWPYAVGKSGHEVVNVEEVASDHYFFEIGCDDLGVSLSVRSVRKGEKVCLLGIDATSAYTSDRFDVADVTVGSGRFWLGGVPTPSEMPWAGALVVALSDGAVVGQCVRDEMTVVGLRVRCVGFPTTVRHVERASDLEVLSRVSEVIEPVLWPESVTSRFLGHEAGLVRMYAEVGRSVAQSEILVDAIRKGVGESVSARYCARVTDARWLPASAGEGFVARLFAVTGKRHVFTVMEQADYVMALVGLVATHEGTECVLRLLSETGWLDEEYGSAVSGGGLVVPESERFKRAVSL